MFLSKRTEVKSAGQAFVFGSHSCRLPLLSVLIKLECTAKGLLTCLLITHHWLGFTPVAILMSESGSKVVPVGRDGSLLACSQVRFAG